ncbi:hypothetical protein JOF28_002705 [Leucobacter exalbidus]|uniref:Uncharacterized protein n=1 Tax=Leucobacter exalbidus TaxID=662960 RepID=A0A940PQI4_9MICO|nr:hypothetical protein [Leucobacter exalbidus]MBP1327473.1 hypothetical protein [Leucobacter exalbidus]
MRFQRRASRSPRGKSELKRYCDVGLIVIDHNVWGTDEESVLEWTSRGYFFAQKRG